MNDVVVFSVDDFAELFDGAEIGRFERTAGDGKLNFFVTVFNGFIGVGGNVNFEVVIFEVFKKRQVKKLDVRIDGGDKENFLFGGFGRHFGLPFCGLAGEGGCFAAAEFEKFVFDDFFAGGDVFLGEDGADGGENDAEVGERGVGFDVAEIERDFLKNGEGVAAVRLGEAGDARANEGATALFAVHGLEVFRNPGARANEGHVAF